MRKPHAMLATAATVTALLAGGTTSANAAAVHRARTVPAAVADDLGCPSAFVCLFGSDGSLIWRADTYGTYNLAHALGYYIVDNQTNNAHIDLCHQYIACFEGPPAGSWGWYDLTSITSIRIHP